jgi:hypothetical protein
VAFGLGQPSRFDKRVAIIAAEKGVVSVVSAQPRNDNPASHPPQHRRDVDLLCLGQVPDAELRPDMA